METDFNQNSNQKNGNISSILNPEVNNNTLTYKHTDKITIMYNYYSKTSILNTPNNNDTEKSNLPNSNSKKGFICNNIHTILSELYNDIFNLNIIYTKSFSNSSKNANYLLWNEDLPLITYGVNIVDSPHFYIFFKQILQINQHLLNSEINLKTKQDFYTAGCELERIIFSDLHLYMVIYSSLLRGNSFNYKLRTFFRYLFQPVASVTTYFKNKNFINQFKRVYSMENLEKVYDMILAINDKMEEFLIMAGGREYCESLGSRNINSFDLAIYSAFKVQQGIVQNYKFNLVEILVDQIDKLRGNTVDNGMKKIQQLSLVSAREKIVPKNIPEQNLVFRQYDNYRHKDTDVNPLYKRLFGIATFFGIILYLKIKKQ